MNEQEAKLQLRRVSEAYPSIREYIHRNAREPDETFSAWVSMLLPCDDSDVTEIVDEIVAGDREPWDQYQKPDAVARNIASEAKSRRHRRAQRKRQFEEYHTSMGRHRSQAPRFGFVQRAT